MKDLLRPYISRIIAVVISFFATWLTSKGIPLDAETQGQISALLNTAIFSIIYAVSHKSIDKKVNPTDAATSALAAKKV